MFNHQQPQDASNALTYRVMYSSKIRRSKSSEEVEQDFEAILSYSRDWNRDAGITGALVTNKRMYAQVIEGPALAVKNLLGHIACDERHQDIRIIASYSAEGRIFADWSMAFVRTNRDLQTEACLFPSGEEQSNLLAVSAFCMAIREHILHGSPF